mmetsp:Transcript_14358/g.32259  ORF Transcript_14358/g.32259 Transcript_14358/m.32259 type:complete len:364 (-) Transcript_14358:25-1116(-)
MASRAGVLPPAADASPCCSGRFWSLVQRACFDTYFLTASGKSPPQAYLGGASSCSSSLFFFTWFSYHPSQWPSWGLGAAIGWASSNSRCFDPGSETMSIPRTGRVVSALGSTTKFNTWIPSVDTTGVPAPLSLGGDTEGTVSSSVIRAYRTTFVPLWLLLGTSALVVIFTTDPVLLPLAAACFVDRSSGTDASSTSQPVSSNRSTAWSAYFLYNPALAVGASSSPVFASVPAAANNTTPGTGGFRLRPRKNTPRVFASAAASGFEAPRGERADRSEAVLRSAAGAAKASVATACTTDTSTRSSSGRVARNFRAHQEWSGIVVVVVVASFVAVGWVLLAIVGIGCVCVNAVLMPLFVWGRSSKK